MTENEIVRLMTPDEVVAALQVTKSWLYDQVQAEAIPFVRLGNRHLRFKAAEIHAYIDGDWKPAEPIGAYRSTSRRKLLVA
jgi:excisionase family DNA binding protein